MILDAVVDSEGGVRAIVPAGRPGERAAEIMDSQLRGGGFTVSVLPFDSAAGDLSYVLTAPYELGSTGGHYIFATAAREQFKAMVGDRVNEGLPFRDKQIARLLEILFWQQEAGIDPLSHMATPFHSLSLLSILDTGHGPVYERYGAWTGRQMPKHTSQIKFWTGDRVRLASVFHHQDKGVITATRRGNRGAAIADVRWGSGAACFYDTRVLIHA